MTDPAAEYDAWANVIRDKTWVIHRAVSPYIPEDQVTQEKLQLAQRIARRLEEVLKEFDLREPE